MKIQEFIDMRVFIISFFLGMMYVYLTTPTPDIIVKYPTPHNVDKIVYTDKTGNCYRYQLKEEKCDASKLKKVKIMRE
jgi:hypothetical protein